MVFIGIAITDLLKACSLERHSRPTTRSIVKTTVREAISKICSRFPESYWLDIDNKARWPSEFQEAIAKDGWLGIMMPSQYGGSELGLAEATVMMQTIVSS